MGKKNLVILGSAGFIGKNLVHHFIKKDEYQVFSHWLNKEPLTDLYNNLKPRFGDLTDRNNVKDILKGADIVLHAAAVTTGAKDVIEQPYLHVTDNAIMNSLVFEEAYKQKVKHVIFLSCTVMYQPKDIAQSENDWNAAEEIYPLYYGVGNMKVYSEKMCRFFSRLGDTKYTAIRHSNVYGPHDKFDLDKCHVMPAMINKVCNSEKELEVWGTGKAARDLIYIDDLVDFIDLCIQKQETPFELMNCGCGNAVPILEIIKKIMEAENKELEIVFNKDKPDIPTTVILNCDKAQKMLGWKPKISLKEGIKKTVQWYKENYA